MSAGDALGTCRRRGELQVQARVCREDADHNAARAEAAEVAVASLARELERSRKVAEDRAARIGQLEQAYTRAEVERCRAASGGATLELVEARKDRDAAREQAAECRLEAAHLHRQLSALGVDPERLASMVGSGQAVELFGRVYVARDVALRDLLRDDDKQEALPYDDGNGMQVAGQLELEEAAAGVFVPLPKGYRLEVSVTPWDDVPDPAADLAEPATHVCSTLCHAAGCPGTA